MVEGAVSVQVGSGTFARDEADNRCAPGCWPTPSRKNLASEQPFVCVGQQAPLHQKCGV